MESSTAPLSIESFSYSWLINLKPTLESMANDSFDASDGASSFIEMDPKMPPSKRFFIASQDFNFDFPTSPFPLDPVHADQIFSNGFLVPFFGSASLPSPPSPSTSQPKTAFLVGKLRCSSLRRCHKLPKQVFHKYLGLLMPLLRRARGSRSTSEVHGGADPRVQVEKKKKQQQQKQWPRSPDSTPARTSAAAYSACNWRRSCDSESSIHEAVLHCKRSIGK